MITDVRPNRSERWPAVEDATKPGEVEERAQPRAAPRRPREILPLEHERRRQERRRPRPHPEQLPRVARVRGGQEQRGGIAEELRDEPLAGAARMDPARHAPHGPDRGRRAEDGAEGRHQERRPPSEPGEHGAGEEQGARVADRGRGEEEPGGPAARGDRKPLGDEDQPRRVVAAHRERGEAVEQGGRDRAVREERERERGRAAGDARPEEGRARADPVREEVEADERARVADLEGRGDRAGRGGRHLPLALQHRQDRRVAREDQGDQEAREAQARQPGRVAAVVSATLTPAALTAAPRHRRRSHRERSCRRD